MPIVDANIGLSIAAGLTGLRIDPYQSCNFVVEIEGIVAGGFSELSGLQVETEAFEYREGGLNEYTHRFAGPTKYPVLTLKHGLSLIDGLWSWHQDVVAGVLNRHNGTIYLLNNMQLPVMWWDFKEALPTKWIGPALGAASSAIAFESVEIVHHGLSRPRRDANSPAVPGELAAGLNIVGGFF
jgi:phage tail-like protein